jgi:hypothetical protein
MNPIESIKKFHFSISGYFARNFDVIIKENKATYCADIYNCDFAKRKEKEISKIQMELFLTKLNQLNITGWDNEYFNPDILDGDQWELELVYNKSNKKSIFGSNLYPNSKTGSEKPSRDFKELLNAIKELIEEPLFFSDKFRSD